MVLEQVAMALAMEEYLFLLAVEPLAIYISGQMAVFLRI